MAQSIKGTAHIYGTGGVNGNAVTITNATIRSINITAAFELNDTTANEAGVIIETRRDSRSFKGTVQLNMREGYTIPAIGSIISLSSAQAPANGNYEVVATPMTFTAGEKAVLELQVERHEGISLNA